MHNKMKILWIFVDLVFLIFQVIDACPSLQIPDNTMVLSLDNSSIEYACKPLHVLTQGNLLRNCNNLSLWTGDPPVCSVMNCTSLAINNSVPIENATVSYGQSIKVDCLPGFSVSVSHSSSPPTIVSSQVIRCLGNASQNSTFWEEPVSCSVITCKDPETRSSSVNNDVGNREHGATITYSCESGYHSRKDMQFNITCSLNATWKEDRYCWRSTYYVGCFDEGTLNISFSEPLSDIENCISSCKELDYRFAALTSNQCLCGNYYDTSTVLLDNSLCNTLCNGQPSLGYCGGFGGKLSLYYTIETGCYEELAASLNDLDPLIVNGDSGTTCIERCRAKDEFYSIFLSSNDTCICTNRSSLVTKNLAKTCEESKSTAIKYTFTNLASHDVQYTSCEELYKAGVRYHDTYYINKNKVFCYFKDGTACDQDWIGYNGFCFHFSVTNKTFREASVYCTSMNTTVASLVTAEDQNFVTEATKVFPDLKKNGNTWYIGLYDSHSVSSFSWIDGNLLTAQHFASSEPSDESRQCGVLREGEWYSYDCANKTNVICKHNNDSLFCIQTTEAFESAYSVTKEDMSLSFCIQACIARGFMYALNNGFVCHCNNTLPTHGRLSFEMCNKGCPSNSYQSCGGLLNGTYTVSKVNDSNKASTCEELQTQGQQGGLFLLKDSDNATFCEDTGCPYSWIKRNSSCYKFMVGKRTRISAAEYCANYSSYLTVLEDKQEETFIHDATKNIGILSKITRWQFGLFSEIYYSEMYRWANGYPSNELIQTVDSSFRRKFGSIEGSVWQLKTEQDSSFICEKGPEYLGCYRYTEGLVLAANLTTSTLTMTVEKCLEMCRGLGYNISMVMQFSCLCNDSVTYMDPYPSGCSKNTFLSTQLVGSADNYAVAAYNNDLYPMYSSCLSLFKQGITVNGLYKFSDGIKWCNFADNTTCLDGWTGYRGMCYMVVTGSMSYSDATETCTTLGGTPVNIRDSDQHNFLKQLLVGERHYTKQSIWIGLSDEFLVGLPTWSTGIITSYHQPTVASQIIGRAMVLKSNTLYNIKSWDAQGVGVICQHNSASEGCYMKPVSLDSVLTSNAMELTQCKQICMGRSNGTGYVMLQGSSCFCIDDVISLTKTNTSLCTLSCAGNAMQICGSHSYYGSVYFYDELDMPTSCSMLEDHRVWYNSTYLINVSGVPVKKECGIFDGKTACQVGWYDKEGYCFRIQPTGLQFDEANTKCLKENGYISYFSSSLSYKNEILQFLTRVTPLAKLSQWWMSLLDVFMNGMYLEGDGHIMLPAEWNNNKTIADNMYSTVTSSDGSWTAVETGTYPYVCERSPGYLGCIKNFTTDEAFPTISFNASWMSATQCIQYCLGQNSTYAATTNIYNCMCLHAFNFTLDNDTECMSCPGYKSQPCGSSSGHLSVFLLEHYRSDIMAGCYALEKIGVIYPGKYIVKSLLHQDPVECFNRSSSIDIIRVASDQYSASTTKENFMASQALIKFPYGSNDVWKPKDADNAPWLQLDLKEEYVVAGISTQGRPSHQNTDWLKSYRLKFKSVITSQWVDSGYNMAGNSDMTSLATVFLAKPFVTRQVRIYPESNTNLAVRVRLYGQDIKTYSHNDSMIGCYLQDTTLFRVVPGINSESDCLSNCSNSEEAFYSFEISCYCIGNPDVLARIETCAHWNALIVKRTFDMFCAIPETAGNSTNTSVFAHTSGVYTIKSTVKYTCYTGYEFPDGKTTKTLTCIDGNVWSANVSDCQIIQCPTLVPPDNAALDSFNTQYGTVVTATCPIGYTLDDKSMEQVAVCQADKTWNITFQSCKAISCGTPPAISGVARGGTDYTYNQTVIYSCPDSMWFSYDTYTKSITCNSNGTWDEIDITQNCTYYKCPQPPTIQKASVTLLNDTFAKYTCRKHFSFENNSSEKIVSCNSYTKVWDAIIGKCEINEKQISRKTGHFTDLGNVLAVNGHGVILEALLEKSVYSYMECADHCIRATYCVAFNYNTDRNSMSNNCRLYEDLAPAEELVSHIKWKYFKADDLDYL